MVGGPIVLHPSDAERDPAQPENATGSALEVIDSGDAALDPEGGTLRSPRLEARSTEAGREVTYRQAPGLSL